MNGSSHTEYKKFNFNSQIMSFDSLRRHLAQTFKINGEFTVNYLNRKFGLLPLTSDIDLDGALLRSRNFCLKLEVQQVELDKRFDEWDIICPADIPPSDDELDRRCANRLGLAGSFFSQVSRKMQRAFSFERSSEFLEPERLPLTSAEFENFLDSDGKIARLRELHVAVFRGGVEPSLRPIVWKHLLNIFPDGLTEKQRKEYLLRKSQEYYRLRDDWKRLIHNGVDVPDVLKNVVNLVLKDVRRTDRQQKFFSGADDNKNTQSLFNILTTYGINHQKVSYCQGMSDILSPILYVMKDEAEAYICFCGLMKRMGENFRRDGRSIKRKFRHLRRMILYYDREMFLYLKKREALGLLFCYRWLVLELKREFAYEDALHVLEVMWGSLPPKSPEKEISLYDVRFPKSDFGSEKQTELLYLDLDDISWDENHFGISPKASETPEQTRNIKSLDLPRRGYEDSLLARKWAARARRESQIRNFELTESSIDEEAEKELLRHCYRRRCHWRLKSERSADSFPGVLTEGLLFDIYDHEGVERKQSDVSKSWAFGVNSGIQPEELDIKKNERISQWCYSNTVKELRLHQLLFEDNNENPESHNGNDGSELSDANNRRRHGSSDSNYSTYSDEFSDDESRSKISQVRNSSSLPQSKSEGYISDTVSTANYSSDYHSEDEDDEREIFDCGIMDSMYGKHQEEALSYFHKRKLLLPPPHVLGDGNPFLLFLCTAMILMHRDEILRQMPDFNELGMFFDKMMRKHRMMTVVCKARSLFESYLNMGWNENLNDSDDDEFEV